MTISEPMTVATDYLLALAGGVWGAALWRDGARRGERAPRLLAASFAAMALGALLGGTAHGFVDRLDRSVVGAIWFATTATVGVAGYCLLAAAATAFLDQPARRLILALGAGKLAVYVIWMTRHQEFRWVILEYGSSMLVVALLALGRVSAAGERRAALWVLGGLALSALGATVQGGGFAPHRHFNHNDLYHVIQIVAVYAFYRGGLDLADRDARRPWTPSATLRSRPRPPCEDGLDSPRPQSRTTPS